jgi:hypothetical protein
MSPERATKPSHCCTLCSVASMQTAGDVVAAQSATSTRTSPGGRGGALPADFVGTVLNRVVEGTLVEGASSRVRNRGP